MDMYMYKKKKINTTKLLILRLVFKWPTTLPPPGPVAEAQIAPPSTGMDPRSPAAQPATISISFPVPTPGVGGWP